MGAPDRSVRADWDQRIGRRRGPGLEGGGPGRLTPPSGLRAMPGRGHVTLDWEPAPGAAGYTGRILPAVRRVRARDQVRAPRAAGRRPCVDGGRLDP